MMSSSVLRDRIAMEILSLCMEDDYGLYEILWRVNELLPTEAEISAKGITEEVLREFLSRGFVHLVKRSGDANADGDAPLTSAEALGSLADDYSWDEPRIGSTELLVSATDEGEAFYRQQGRGE